MRSCGGPTGPKKSDGTRHRESNAVTAMDTDCITMVHERHSFCTRAPEIAAIALPIVLATSATVLSNGATPNIFSAKLTRYSTDASIVSQTCALSLYRSAFHLTRDVHAHPDTIRLLSDRVSRDGYFNGPVQSPLAARLQRLPVTKRLVHRA